MEQTAYNMGVKCEWDDIQVMKLKGKKAGGNRRGEAKVQLPEAASPRRAKASCEVALWGCSLPSVLEVVDF